MAQKIFFNGGETSFLKPLNPYSKFLLLIKLATRTTMSGMTILTEKSETCSLLSTVIPRWVKIIHVLYFVRNRNENIRAGIHQQLGNS